MLEEHIWAGTEGRFPLATEQKGLAELCHSQWDTSMYLEFKKAEMLSPKPWKRGQIALDFDHMTWLERETSRWKICGEKSVMTHLDTVWTQEQNALSCYLKMYAPVHFAVDHLVRTAVCASILPFTRVGTDHV